MYKLLQVTRLFVPLHRVFHGIRFKVNEDWESGKIPFFICMLGMSIS